MMSWFSAERILGRGLLLPAQALFEPERVPLKLDDTATVGETVQDAAKELKDHYILGTLTKHHRLILDVVKDAGKDGLLANYLWQASGWGGSQRPLGRTPATWLHWCL